jgi:two-component sensor histidine kinase
MEEHSLLEKSDVFLSAKENKLTISDILDRNLFRPWHSRHINIGLKPTTIWIRFTLSNPTDLPVSKLLVFTSPLLEHIKLYRDSDHPPVLRGIAHIDKKVHKTLFPFYPITLPPHSSRSYYLEIWSDMLPVDVSLKLKDTQEHIDEDRYQQLVNILLVGFVLALALYSFILFFYIKDKSYLYYSFYLFALIYQQITYLGLTQVYFPSEFILFDMKIPVLKVNLLIITAALFAIHFLRIEHIRPLYRIYQAFIMVSVAEILFLDQMSYITLYIAILTGSLFILFNLLSGIISYLRGLRQARLFIIGFGIVFISYIFIILDALGFTSFMQNFQNILMFSTAFEALILSLAFADRYIILQKEKTHIDKKMLRELQNRKQIIQQKVDEKTEELNLALEEKELLLQEIHHRVKNNLQIILSIIRMQNDNSLDRNTQNALTKLENRINAISKTYNILLINNRFEKIDMKEYLNELITDIIDAIGKEKDITIQMNTEMELTLKEAVYIGLIVNELVTNAYKHAFPSNQGMISISLYQDGDSRVLEIYDNGIGYTHHKKETSFGLKLIHTLVKHQLKGTIFLDTKNKTHCIIRF